MPKFKRWQIISFVILVLLILLNPTFKQFNEFTGGKKNVRKYNFLVCSIYQDGDMGYLGILMNFIEIYDNVSHNRFSEKEFDVSKIDCTDIKAHSPTAIDILKEYNKQYSDSLKHANK